MKNAILDKIRIRTEELEKLLNDRVRIAEVLKNTNHRITELNAVIIELKELLEEPSDPS